MGDRSENLAFGQRIRAAMAVARVSRQDVARACGTSPQGVQRWCDGTSYPSSSKLITFCNMTGCSAEWLLWPHPVDIRSTDWAINGTHIKNIVRQAMDDLAAEQSTPPITPDADTAAELAKLRERAEKAEQERVAEWNRRRDADGSRDAARAACDTMRAERDTLAASPEVAKLIAEAVAAERGPEVWLIYKNGRGWYRPNAQGYTNAVAEAGRYTYADAMKHSHPNGPEGPRDGMKIKHIENVLKDEAAAIRRGATL